MPCNHYSVIHILISTDPPNRGQYLSSPYMQNLRLWVIIRFVIVVTMDIILGRHHGVFSMCLPDIVASTSTLHQRVPRVCLICEEFNQQSRECPRREQVFQIGSTYFPSYPRAPKVFYDCGEDGLFSRKYTKHQLVSQLGSAHVSHQVRTSRVFYDFVQTNHQSIECPLHGTIRYSAHPNQSHSIVAPSVKYIVLSAFVVDSDFMFGFGPLRFVHLQAYQDYYFRLHRYRSTLIYHHLICIEIELGFSCPLVLIYLIVTILVVAAFVCIICICD